MNQQKIGEFLKHLRKDKGLTQEQLAEQFYVSSRTVSRWETGSNMPDLDLLINLADFYDVDIREIIDGERKSENMNNETKDTLKKVAEYVAEEKKKINNKFMRSAGMTVIVFVLNAMLFGKPVQGYLYGTIPEHICNAISTTISVIGICFCFSFLFYTLGHFDKLIERKVRNRQ